MQDLLFTLIPGLALLCYVGLCVYVTWRGSSSRSTRWFALYLLLMAIWSLSALMLRLDGSHTEFWWRLASLMAIGMLLPMLAFARAFVGIDRPRWLPWAVLCAYVLLAVPLNWQRGVVSTIGGVSGGKVHYELGPLVYPIALLSITIFALSVAYLVAGYRRTTDPVQRNRIRYPLLGIVISFLGLFTNSVPALGAYPLDNASNVLNALLITYTIVRYRLLDLTLVLRRGLAWGLILFVVGLIYLFSLVVGQAIASATWLGILVAVVALTALTLAVVPGLLELAQAAIDRLLFRDRYDARLMLRDISAAALSLRPLDELATMLLAETARAMNITTGAFLGRDEPSGPYRLLAQIGYEPPVTDLEMRADHPLISYLGQTEQVMPRERIQFVPQFKSMWARELDDLDRLQGEVFVGVPDGGGVLGVFVFGAKHLGVPYSQPDCNVLATLANQTAVAIANARLYRQANLHLRNLQRANEELVQLDQMKDEFVQTVSHELRTPITFIRGYVELLLEGALGTLENEQDDALRTVMKATDGVIALVNDVITLTRGADLGITPEKVDIGSVASMRALGASAAAESAGLQMVTVVPDDLPPVPGDERRLGQVFDNLIGNAIKFSPQGGIITVSAAAEDGVVHCSVSDQGIGIPSEKLDLVWDRFYQVEQSSTRRFGGTGLGLAIVRRIIEAHGGRVWAESTPERGSTFHFTLPLEPRSGRDLSPNPSPARGGGPDSPLPVSGGGQGG